MRRSIIGLLLLTFLLPFFLCSCGNIRAQRQAEKKTAEAETVLEKFNTSNIRGQRQAEKKTCLSNMKCFLSAADIYASYYDGYPTSSSAGTTPYKWPQDFYDGELRNGAPVCPGGGVITVYYGDSMTRPRITCSKHGSP